jgi:hypothetical protein
MKHPFKPMLIVLALCLLSCSAPETSEQVLRRLMEAKMKDGKFADTNAPGTLTRISSNPDGVDYSLEGLYRMRNELLIITIQNNVEDNQQYHTGVFKESNNGWQSLFEADLIPGRLDTLVDLNHDGLDEFILDEYQGNSSGFDSYQFLYAKKDKSTWEKVDTLSRRVAQPGASREANLSFENQGGETVLIVNVKEYLGDAATETASAYTYRWQSPNLVKEKIDHESQRDMAEFSDPLTEDLVVAGFLTKWFPLAESDGKLKRQQLCGAESFIEFVATDQPTWRDQGFDNVWEAPLDAFMPKGEGSYLITLKLPDGSKKEIKFERNLDVDFVYTVDGRSYTNQPDKFEVVNDTEACGD